MMKKRKILLICSLFIFLICSTENNYALGGDVRNQKIEKRVIELINEVRAKGIKCGNKYYKATTPVVWNEKLGKASLHHSLDMAQKGFLGHRGSDGSSTEERLSKVGYKWIVYGENVGEGYQTPGEMVSGWLKSTSHCKNIMNPDFKEAGAAYIKGSVKNYWTLILASPEVKYEIK
jgi:uncharacterized protein YkwD